VPWKTFLKTHSEAIAAADFFSVEVLTIGGFVRYLVLFIIDLKTTRVHVAGISPNADGAWMVQIARNRTDSVCGPLRGFTHLIVDRDPLYTAQFRSLLAFPSPSPATGRRIRRSERLGGLLKFYERTAA
jgi:putative transposase